MLRLALSLIAALLAPAPLMAAEKFDLPVGSIGKINQAGLWKRSNCTGTLIAPDKVLTAAHCLRDEFTGEVFPFDSLHFLPGFSKGKYLAHGRVKGVRFLGIAPPGKIASEAALLTDAAVIDLTEPLDLPVVPLDDPADVPKMVIHTGYMKAHPDNLTITKPCGVQALPSGLWVSNCHAEPGSSGGPVLALESDTVSLSGILIAVGDKGVSIVLPVARMGELLNEEGVAPPDAASAPQPSASP